MMKAGGLLLLLAAILSFSCTPEPPQDSALLAWAAQMEAAGKARETGDLAAAQTHYEAASQLAFTDGRLRLVVRSLEGLAQQAASRGDYASADSLFRVILARQIDSLKTTGVPADDLLRTLGTLGDIALQLGEPAGAAARYEQIFRFADEGWLDLSPQRPHLSLVLAGQARVMQATGDSAGAARTGVRATGLRHYAHGFDLFIGQRYDEAEAQLQRALAYQIEHLGESHADVALTRADLAHVRELRGQIGTTGNPVETTGNPVEE